MYKTPNTCGSFYSSVMSEKSDWETRNVNIHLGSKNVKKNKQQQKKE